MVRRRNGSNSCCGWRWTASSVSSSRCCTGTGRRGASLILKVPHISIRVEHDPEVGRGDDLRNTCLVRYPKEVTLTTLTGKLGYGERLTRGRFYHLWFGM